MARPYAKLRGLMVEYGETQTDLGRLLLLSNPAISSRMNNRSSWSLDEMYTLMDHYHVPHDQLHRVFPKSGRNE